MTNIFQIEQIRNKQTINTNRWTIEFIGLKQMLNAARESKLPWIRNRYEAVKQALGSEDSLGTSLQISLFDANIPSVKLATAEMPRFNDQTKAVTKFEPMDDLVITFFDYVNGSASAIMQLWHAFVGDKKTGAIGFKEDFVLETAYFKVYGPDAPGYNIGQDAAAGEIAEVPWLQKYKIWNMFPKDVVLGTHSDSAEPRKITVNFALDNFYPVGIRGYNTQDNTTNQSPDSRYTDIPETATPDSNY